MNWAEVRALFPAVDDVVYLNAAGGAPLSEPAASAGRQYYDEALAEGDLAWPRWLERVEQARASAALAMGGRSGDIVFMPNASTALSICERLLGDDKGLLAPEGDFPSITIPWLANSHPIWFFPNERGTVDLGALPAAALGRAGTLAVGHVHYRTGHKVDLAACGRAAREYGLALVVDATQSFGLQEIDAPATGADAVLASVYKWPAAGYGCAVLWLRDGVLDGRTLPLAGWRSAEAPYALLSDRFTPQPGAIALEAGHPPFAPVFALGAALDLIERIGRQTAEARVLSLAAIVHEGLTARGLPPLAPARSGIVSVRLENADHVRQGLRKAGVIVGGFESVLRISPSFYNTRQDVDAFFAAFDAAQERSGD